MKLEQFSHETLVRMTNDLSEINERLLSEISHLSGRLESIEKTCAEETAAADKWARRCTELVLGNRNLADVLIGMENSIPIPQLLPFCGILYALGAKIPAIKIYRGSTSVGLIEAKDAIEDWHKEWSLRNNV